MTIQKFGGRMKNIIHPIFKWLLKKGCCKSIVNRNNTIVFFTQLAKRLNIHTLDGGIRRGSDIVKALCLGARAVMVGRAYAYGLGAAGGAGVARAIEILRADLIRTLKLLGCPSLGELDRSYVDVPADWLRK